MTRATERGTTVVVIATSLLMLLGFTALAVDAGLAYSERRGTTNAADSAALAAAWEECNPSGIGPIPAARETAASNSYDDTEPDTAVDVESLGEGEWRVRISKMTEGIFSPATPFADDSMTVVSEALALCDPTEFLEGMAIFAGGDTCGPTELKATGSSITVNGGIHSNGALQIHATPETEHLTGPITYRESGTHGEQVSGPPIEYPLDVEVSEYATAGSGRAVGLYFGTNVQIDNDWLDDQGFLDPVTGNLTQSGIYYTSYSHPGQPAIDLHGLKADPGVTVTFVAQGSIKITGATDNLRAHDAIEPGGTVGILFLSNHPGPPPGSCNSMAVEISAPTFSNAAGVIYAPNGVIGISNSTAVLDGSIIGWRVDVAGSNLTVNYEDDPAFVPKFQVELIR